MTHECTDCVYFDELTDDAGASVGGGICKRYPPTPLVMIDTAGGFEVVPTLPTVHSEHWCGEWKDGQIAGSSMILPAAENTPGRMKFHAWLADSGHEYPAQYVGENLHFIIDGDTVIARPGDRIVIDSTGISII